jgi:predicted HAD superfamily Cof-like phosphohydrolase
VEELVMNDFQAKVRAYCRDIIGAPHGPADPQIRDGRLRARLMLEESLETAIGLVGEDEAFKVLDEIDGETCRKLARDGRVGCGPDIVEVIDGVCDTIYVALGTAEALGVDIAPFFELVHAANMAKTPAPVDGHGKRGGKPDGWQDPKHDIRRLLEEVRRRARDAHEYGAFWDGGEVTDDMIVSVADAIERRGE